MQDLFFELIQVALGNRDRLSRMPSLEEWVLLYGICKKQTVLGIAYHALEQLASQDQKAPRDIYMKWFTVKRKIENRNALFDKRCIDVQKLYSESGIRSSILKGQGLACYYGELRSLRQSGDIDLYVDCGRERALSFARELGQKDINWNYKHLDLNIYEGVKIEVHYHVETFYNPFKSKRLEDWFLQNKELLFTEKCGFIVPSTTYNLFYVLLHLYNHFISSGVGLRQLIDYYFVLRAAEGASVSFKNGESIQDVLETFGMTRFARGVMWLLQEVAGLSSEYMFCEPLEKEGRWILDDIMTTGNFGEYFKKTKDNKRLSRSQIIVNMTKRGFRLFKLCSSDALWAPAWAVGHKCWKLTKK